MKDKTFKLILKLTTLSLAVAVLIIALGLLGNPKAMTAATASTNIEPPQGRDEVAITLGSSGFSPNEIHHAPGTFAVAIENRAIEGEYTLRLSAQDGTVLKEIHVEKGSAVVTVSLQTGTYTLTEIGHLQWSCVITVQ